MSTESEDLQRLRLVVERQESEAQLNGSRNSYFLVVMSILILAFGQTPVGDLAQLAVFRLLISLLGVAISVVWVLIQRRSSQYILYYKNNARELAKLAGMPDFYPQGLLGVEMRKLVYALPFAFLFVWVPLFCLALTNILGALAILLLVSLALLYVC